MAIHNYKKIMVLALVGLFLVFSNVSYADVVVVNQPCPRGGTVTPYQDLEKIYFSIGIGRSVEKFQELTGVTAQDLSKLVTNLLEETVATCIQSEDRKNLVEEITSLKDERIYQDHVLTLNIGMDYTDISYMGSSIPILDIVMNRYRHENTKEIALMRIQAGKSPDLIILDKPKSKILEEIRNNLRKMF